MASKKKTPVGRQQRPGEAVEATKKPKPGDSLPDGYSGPAGAVKGRKPTVGANTETTRTRPGDRLPDGYNGPAGMVKGGKPTVGAESKRDRKYRKQAERKPGKPGKPGKSGVTGAPAAPTTPAQPTGPDPARLRLEAYVRMVGFPVSMVDALMDARGKGLITDDSGIEDYIAVGVEQPDFQARFPAIVNRWKRMQSGEPGLEMITPLQVMEYEKRVRDTADDYGLSSWVSSPEQIARLIDNNVSADEAVERIETAGYAAVTAPKEFREAFFKQFGLTEGNLVGYFLDPDKEEGEIRKSVAQGRLVASAMQNGFANNWNIGERLLERGVNPESAMSGFAAAALSKGLGSGIGATVSEDAMIDAEFGDAAAQGQVASVAAQRAGRFNTVGGAVESQQGVTGLASSQST